jgi:hypothetical protein
MAAKGDVRLCLLPVDAQASILSFLPYSDLARFSSVSRGSRDVAAMDHLWRHLLARHFGDVTLPAHLLSNPLRLQFHELALSICTACGWGDDVYWYAS